MEIKNITLCIDASFQQRERKRKRLQRQRPFVYLVKVAHRGRQQLEEEKELCWLGKLHMKDKLF